MSALGNGWRDKECVWRAAEVLGLRGRVREVGSHGDMEKAALFPTPEKPTECLEVGTGFAANWVPILKTC